MKQDNRPDTKAPNATSAAVNKPPHFGILRRIVFSFLVILVLFAGMGGWAAVAELSGAVISHGSVVVDGRAKKIQHREGGIVAAIKVKNGDRVNQGDLLIVLDSTQARAELAIVRSQLVELRMRHARLAAERGSDDEVVFPSELIADDQGKAIAAGELRLFDDARNVRDSQKEQLTFRIAQLGKEGEGTAAQIVAKKKELALIEKELADVRDLFSRKLTQATRVYALEREQTRLLGELGNLTAQIARLEGQIAEIKIQIINIDQTARAEAQREVRSVEARIAELREREIAQKDRLDRMEIRAPQKGIVHELQTHTIGGVISSAEPIMLIVPDDQLLMIELRIPPADIDQLYIGQPVRLRFTAFNQRMTPEKNGRVSFVSADVSHDSKSRIDYYSTLVALKEGEEYKVGDHPILPGMPVEAFVTTPTRTALTYFMKPLADNFERALRED